MVDENHRIPEIFYISQTKMQQNDVIFYKRRISETGASNYLGAFLNDPFCEEKAREFDEHLQKGNPDILNFRK